MVNILLFHAINIQTLYFNQKKGIFYFFLYFPQEKLPHCRICIIKMIRQR